MHIELRRLKVFGIRPANPNGNKSVTGTWIVCI